MGRMKRVSRDTMRGKGGNFFEWRFGLTLAYLLQTFVLGYPSLKILLRYAAQVARGPNQLMQPQPIDVFKQSIQPSTRTPPNATLIPLCP